MIASSVQLTPELKEKIKAKAKELCISENSIVRIALSEYLNKEEK